MVYAKPISAAAYTARLDQRRFRWLRQFKCLAAGGVGAISFF